MPPIATATSEPALGFLTGPALRAVIAERMDQIEVHGYLPDTDMLYQEGELALAELRGRESIYWGLVLNHKGWCQVNLGL